MLVVLARWDSFQPFFAILSDFLDALGQLFIRGGFQQLER
jgi:hypothetical protein